MLRFQIHLAATLLLFAFLPSHAQGQSPTPLPEKSEAELNDEAARADALYQKSQLLEALPLYQDLHARRPQRPFYTERLAMTWVAKSGTAASAAERAASQEQAHKLLLEAKAAGDNSDLLQIMLEKLTAANQPAPKGPPVAGGESLQQAELLFNKGDLKGATALYAKAWQQNPQLYAAPLFAGDVEYKQNHYAEAGVWYARAIAIDPNRETAHRYWADVLVKDHKIKEANDQYIEAFIAEPYARAPRLVLGTFLRSSQIIFSPPAITLPPPPTRDKDGHLTLTVDPSKANDPLAAAWLGYPMQTVAWQNGKFAKQYPNEKTYRHSLAEESEGLHNLLTVVRSLNIPESKYDNTVRNLMALEKDNMIECWILLDAPDYGTAQDYNAYRAAHRDLLRAYIQKYDFHVAPPAATPASPAPANPAASPYI